MEPTSTTTIRTYNTNQLSDVLDEELLLDANVLVCALWPDLARNPRTNRYRRAYGYLSRHGVIMHLHWGVVSEVSNTVIHRSWENWLDDRSILGLPSDISFKDYRDSVEGQLVQSETKLVFKNSIFPYVELIDRPFTKDELLELLSPARLDFTDSTLVFLSKSGSLIVFTDDKDFVYSDADILTANGKILCMDRSVV
jgi:predicted nucleic acid-binding protein